MIRVVSYEPKTRKTLHGGAELLDPWKKSADKLICVDIESVANENDEELLHEFGIHPLAIQDALRPRHPPKVERFLISRHIGRSISADWLIDQKKIEPQLMAEGTGSPAIRLSNRLARPYVDILLGFEPRLDTVFFAPLTFLAGIYGMNFQKMPELETKSGYFVVIAVMVFIAVIHLIYFRERRWLQ